MRFSIQQQVSVILCSGGSERRHYYHDLARGCTRSFLRPKTTFRSRSPADKNQQRCRTVASWPKEASKSSINNAIHSVMKSKSHGVSLAKLALTRAGAARIVTNAISREPPDNRPDIFSPSLPRNQALAAVVMAPHSRYYVVDVLRSPEGPWRPSPAKSGGKSAAGKWRCHKESRANEWKTPASRVPSCVPSCSWPRLGRVETSRVEVRLPVEGRRCPGPRRRLDEPVSDFPVPEAADPFLRCRIAKESAADPIFTLLPSDALLLSSRD
jgi:hypothetical protein